MKHIVRSINSRFSPAALFAALILMGAAIGGVAYASTRDLSKQQLHLSGWCHSLWLLLQGL